jgi:hypothetical protein
LVSDGAASTEILAPGFLLQRIKRNPLIPEVSTHPCWAVRKSSADHASAAAHKVELSGDLRPSSFRRYLHRHVDAARRRFLKRMRCKINLREQLQIGGPDRIAERLLIAVSWIRGGRQVDPHAMRADHLRSTLKAGILLVRSGRLAQIESLCAHLDSNSDFLGRNTAGEEYAGNGGAKNWPGTLDSSSGVHVNFSSSIGVDRLFGTLITSPRAANWTPLNSG